MYNDISVGRSGCIDPISSIPLLLRICRSLYLLERNVEEGISTRENSYVDWYRVRGECDSNEAR